MTRIDLLETTGRGLGIVAIFGANLFAVELPALPQTEFADTQVSTNLVFAVGEGSNRKLVRSRHIDPSWNLVKVTRRGLSVANENIAIDLIESGFGVVIR